MKYYTYAYLRKDGTPYYIGLGSGKRIYKRNKNCIKPPVNGGKAIILKNNLSLEEAKKHEIYMISLFGRKDNNTGILHNRTNGGDGVWGRIPSEKHRKICSEAAKRDMKKKVGMWALSKEDHDKGRMKGSISSAKSCSREFIVEEISTGKIIKGFNVTSFCREKGILQSNFTSMLKGRQKSAYGFRLPSVI